MSLRRPQKPQPIHEPILIVCEGHLETSYFSVFRQHPNVRRRFHLDVQCAYGGKHRRVVDRAEKNASKLRNGTQIWCIFDVEHDPYCPQLQESLQRCNQRGFKVGLSNPCFNIWVIAHFENIATGTLTPDESRHKLQSLSVGKLDVRSTDWIKKKILGGDEFPNIQLALKNVTCFSSSKTDQIRSKNPSTSVSDLVKILTGL